MPKLKSWSSFLVLVRAMALVLLMLWSGRMDIPAKSSYFQAESYRRGWRRDGVVFRWDQSLVEIQGNKKPII